MKLDSNDFELFALPVQYAQDVAAIDARWRAMQAEVHPDRHVAGGAAAQRRAMQWAVRVNEAHQRLRDPLRRGAYLCELQGAPIGAETNTAMPAEFLMHQMAWREALDEARTLPEVERLDAEVSTYRAAALARLGALLDEAHDASAAAAEVRALMFVERFALDIERRLEALEQ